MDETDATKLTHTRGDFGVSGLTPGRDPILRNEELLMPFFCWFLCASTALLLVWDETFGLHGAARARTLAPERAEATERGATAGAAGGAPSEAAREAAQAYSAAPTPMAASATRWARTETRNEPHRCAACISGSQSHCGIGAAE